jgi:hypothetical protein
MIFSGVRVRLLKTVSVARPSREIGVGVPTVVVRAVLNMRVPSCTIRRDRIQRNCFSVLGKSPRVIKTNSLTNVDTGVDRRWYLYWNQLFKHTDDVSVRAPESWMPSLFRMGRRGISSDCLLQISIRMHPSEGVWVTYVSRASFAMSSAMLMTLSFVSEVWVAFQPANFERASMSSRRLRRVLSFFLSQSPISCFTISWLSVRISSSTVLRSHESAIFSAPSLTAWYSATLFV